MFCTGAAPVVPGIRARFSSPGSRCQRPGHHVVPALAGTDLDDPGVVARFEQANALISTFSTNGSRSLVSTRLLPLPKTNFGARPNSGWSTTPDISCFARMRTGRRATAGSPKVL